MTSRFSVKWRTNIFTLKRQHFCRLLKGPSISPSYMQIHSIYILTSVQKEKKNPHTLNSYILHYKTLYLKPDKVCFQHVHFKYKGSHLGQESTFERTHNGFILWLNISCNHASPVPESCYFWASDTRYWAKQQNKSNSLAKQKTSRQILRALPWSWKIIFQKKYAHRFKKTHT